MGKIALIFSIMQLVLAGLVPSLPYLMIPAITLGEFPYYFEHTLRLGIGF